MKMFWALIVALVLTTGVLLASRGGSEPSGGTTLPTADTRSEPPAQQATASPITAQPAPETAPNAEADTPEAGVPDDEPDEPVVVEVGIPDVSETPTEPTATTDAAPLADDAAVTNTAPKPGDTQPPAAEAIADADSSIPEAADAAEQEAGLLVNNRYRIPGEGTEASPYVVNFDMLVAVEQEYAPREEGKTEVPEWIKVLDGKHVSITGFVAFPFLAATADECMVMLNQWDGCCIGVPPTPYDAVEVQFAQPLDLNRGIPNYGTITGVFRTDPFLTNGWLLGLYMMDNAKLTDSGSKNQDGF